MGKREDYEQRTTRLVMPVIEENGFELDDMEYVKEAGTWYLRAYIDKPGGITINDCELVNRYLSDRLDEDDFIEDWQKEGASRQGGSAEGVYGYFTLV